MIARVEGYIEGVRGVVYDLDGTAIDTKLLHENAWQKAAAALGIKLPPNFLLDQRGKPDDEAARLACGGDLELAARLAKAKPEAVMETMGDITPYPGFFETVEALRHSGLPVWICTSAGRSFVEKLFAAERRFASFEGRTVFREMYKLGKPNPEALLLTFERMGIRAARNLYVGDAHSDFAASQNAGCAFAYFLDGEPDPRIPEVTTIYKHHDLLDLI